jgi:hypothetical protein
VENKEEKVEEEKTQAASQVTTPSEVITFTIERVYTAITAYVCKCMGVDKVA